MENTPRTTSGFTLTRWGLEIIESAQRLNAVNNHALDAASSISIQIRAVGTTVVRPPANTHRRTSAKHDHPPSYESLFGPLPSYAAAVRQHRKQQRAQRAHVIAALPLREPHTSCGRIDGQHHAQPITQPDSPRPQQYLALRNEVSRL